MQIIIQTQFRENYGAHAWDGKGECPQYWKNKGGSVYVVTGVSVHDHAQFASIVEKASRHFDCIYASEYAEEFIIDWEVTEDGAVTWEEWETPKRVELHKL